MLRTWVEDGELRARVSATFDILNEKEEEVRFRESASLLRFFVNWVDTYLVRASVARPDPERDDRGLRE